MSAADGLGKRAVVIGGSIAGLAAARVLSDFFEEVLIFERDNIDNSPAPRKSVPQGRHIHSLLASGYRVLCTLFPDFAKRLSESNGIHYRIGVDTAYYYPDSNAYTLFGKWHTPCDTGIDVYSQSRGLLEHLVRQCTLKTSNISLKTETTVEEISSRSGEVTGVRYKDREGLHDLKTDLVLDASGRGSKACHWLNHLGYPAPTETSIGVQFAYSSSVYRIPADYDDSARVVLVVSADYPYGGILQEIEDRKWIVSLGSRFGNYPPVDEPGFLSFARNLHSPRIYELISTAERIEDISGYRYPTSLWRHYERMRSFPTGFLLIGDSICSFNPIYGQGMSVALLQAEALSKILECFRKKKQNLGRLWHVFFSEAAKINQTAWTLAANLDFVYPQTTGVRPKFMAFRMRFGEALDELAREDPQLTTLLYEVYHLLKPISSLSSISNSSRAFLQMCRKLSRNIYSPASPSTEFSQG